jgi:hypothetical protein
MKQVCMPLLFQCRLSWCIVLYQLTASVQETSQTEVLVHMSQCVWLTAMLTRVNFPVSWSDWLYFVLHVICYKKKFACFYSQLLRRGITVQNHIAFCENRQLHHISRNFIIRTFLRTSFVISHRTASSPATWITHPVPLQHAFVEDIVIVVAAEARTEMHLLRYAARLR